MKKRFIFSSSVEGLPGINVRSDCFGYGIGVGLHFCACSAGYLRNKLRKCCRVERIEECHSISILDRQGIQRGGCAYGCKVEFALSVAFDSRVDALSRGVALRGRMSSRKRERAPPKEGTRSSQRRETKVRRATGMTGGQGLLPQLLQCH